jgi:hypothetical protein
VPGGVEASLDPSHAEALVRQTHDVEAETATLHGIFDEHAGLQDRFITTGASRRTSRGIWGSQASPGAPPGRPTTCASTIPARPTTAST